jgi:tetratricopeptide (TPR) repeat protein
MIPVFEALSWLNMFDESYLTSVSLPYIRKILRKDSNEETVRYFIDRAINLCLTLSDDFHRAEIFVNCGAVECSLKSPADAIQHLQQAERIYSEQYECHRLAVVLWILGIVELETINKRHGYVCWWQANQIFRKLAGSASHYFNPVTKSWNVIIDIQNWYLARYKETMEDLVCLPEEAYRWLNEFSPSHLSTIAKGIRKLAIEKMNGGQFSSTYQFIGELQKLCNGCSDYLEVPEILVECGLLEYEMGNLEGAIELVDQAVSKYNPGSHQQAVARWMLGACLWQAPAKINQATTSWEQSISSFADLAEKASHLGHLTQVRWYREKREYMLTALNNEVNTHFSRL